MKLLRIVKITSRQDRDRYLRCSPLIVSTSILCTGAAGKAAGHAPNLHSQEVVRALTGVSPPSSVQETKVRTATIV